MAKVFLLNCNTAVEPYPVYPLGMSMVAAALEGAGHRVLQYDLLALGQGEGLESAIRDFAPDYLGLSLRNIDNVDSTAQEDHWYLGRVKRLMPGIRQAAGGAPVILGGPAFSIMPEAILEFLEADHGVTGAGERAMPELLAMLGNGEHPPRLIKGTVHSWPRPSLPPDILGHYLRESGMANLQTKRGCVFNCAYCTYPSLEGRKFLYRPPEEVAEDMLWLHREYGVDHVFFTDSVFNDPQGRYLEIAETLIRRASPMQWAAFFRPQGMRVQDIRLLEQSGCHAMELGTDAASDATLEGLGKGFDFAEVLRCQETIDAVGLPAAHFVIFGGPGETWDSFEQGLENIRRLGRAPVFAFSGIRVLPGTALHARAQEEGVLSPDMPLLRPFYYFSPDIEPDELNARLTEAWKGERTRFFPPEEGQLRMNVMRRFGYRGLLWDKLLEKPKRYGNLSTLKGT